MGARKKKVLGLKEKSHGSKTVNSSVTARNLRKSDLGGVIFGCKHSTINECYSEQLFGLPASHISYVRNIDPGLKLFLFNYSDRKLHGIFEAASKGQMYISRYGWAEDGSGLTPYPAQVQIQIQRQCQPLREDQFKPIIAKNYFQATFFWFELDRTQTSKLIELFSSSPVTASTSLAHSTSKGNTPFKTLPTLDTREDGKNTENPDLNVKRSQAGQYVTEWGGSSFNAPHWAGESHLPGALTTEEGAEAFEQEAIHLKRPCEHTYSSVVKNTSASLPQKKWTSLFKTSPTDDRRRDSGDAKKSDATNSSYTEKSNMGWDTSCTAPHLDEDNTPLEASWEAVWDDQNEELTWSKPSFENSRSSVMTQVGGSVTLDSSVEAVSTSNAREKCEDFEKGALEANNLCINESNMEGGLVFPGLYGESQGWEDSVEENVINTHEEEHGHLEPIYECSYPAATKEMNPKESESEDSEVETEDFCSSGGAQGSDTKSSGLHLVVSKLMREMEELKASYLQLFRKVHYLEQELVLVKKEVRGPKDQSVLLPSVAYDELLNEPHSNFSESIYVVGGYDGSSWLSALDSYLPSHDVMRSLTPMNFLRSYASVAQLNGKLYILGGVDGCNNLWYDTVELYNPLSDKWVSCPSLNQRKGSLAGASLKDKIFAIGGGNGIECFSDVEMFDPDVGRWIPSRSMLHKRFAPAAAEINGMIYVVGGYDGQDYLKSVEGFDPREHSWKKLKSMSTQRGCHSVAVLNEKLYALGGYDGTRMVPSVEVFEPRTGSWMTGESMTGSRGYCGAAVIDQTIYVIGGMDRNNAILDSVECYKEGQGWEMTDLKAVGKRCFFSAIVL